MALHTISIAADGSTQPEHVNHGEKVRWLAAQVNGAFPVWYVIFPSPFLDHFISTSPIDGLTPSFKVRKTKGMYGYMVSSDNDPTMAQIKKGEEGRRKPVNVMPGGGIIIDS